jgi:hypothetical protein
LPLPEEEATGIFGADDAFGAIFGAKFDDTTAVAEEAVGVAISMNVGIRHRTSVEATNPRSISKRTTKTALERTISPLRGAVTEGSSVRETRLNHVF